MANGARPSGGRRGRGTFGCSHGRSGPTGPAAGLGRQDHVLTPQSAGLVLQRGSLHSWLRPTCRDSLGLFSPQARAPVAAGQQGQLTACSDAEDVKCRSVVFEVPLAHWTGGSRESQAPCRGPSHACHPLCWERLPRCGARVPLATHRTSLLSWDTVPSGLRLRVCRCRSVLPRGSGFPRPSAQQLCPQMRQDRLLRTHSSCSVCGAFVGTRGRAVTV